MKNTKAFFLIVLGSFIITAGAAFAENISYGQADKVWKDDQRAATVSPSPTINRGLGTPAYTVASTSPAPADPAKDKARKQAIKDTTRKVLLGGLGAYMGFALLGPVGLVLGAFIFLHVGTL